MPNPEAQRPDPDTLLARVKDDESRARRGRLRIFFGATAGVGKSYAMLEAARAQAAAGLDVVVGYVELHGRRETEALLAGLEVLPPQMLEHRGIALAEFDLDGALARAARLIAVDELAHSNHPGARASAASRSNSARAMPRCWSFCGASTSRPSSNASVSRRPCNST